MTTLSFSLVMLRSLPEIEVIEYSMSFCRSNALRISGTVAPSEVILLIARLMVKYSLSVGSTRMPMSATKPMTMAQKSRPNSVKPR